MAEVIYLPPHEQMPDLGDDQRWLTVEASRDGRFFGAGGSWKADGEWVGRKIRRSDNLGPADTLGLRLP